MENYLTPIAWLWMVAFYILAVGSGVLAVGAALEELRPSFLWGFLAAPLAGSVALLLQSYALTHPVHLW